MGGLGQSSQQLLLSMAASIGIWPLVLANFLHLHGGGPHWWGNLGVVWLRLDNYYSPCAAQQTCWKEVDRSHIRPLQTVVFFGIVANGFHPAWSVPA